MSTRKRKRCGGAVHSNQAQKRSRLLASSAGGASEAEPVDIKESGAVFFELVVEEVLDLTGEYSGLQVINLTGNDAVVHGEENEEHSLISGTADNSSVLQLNDNEEESNNDESSDEDDSWPPWPLNSPVSVAGSPEHGEQQNEEHSLVPGAADNSPVLPKNDSKEESKAEDDYLPPRPLCFLASYTRALDDSFKHREQQNEEHSLVPGAADNSRALPMTDSEEETSDEDGSWPPWPRSYLLSMTKAMHDSYLHGEQQNEEHLFVPGAADNSPVSPMSDNVEGSSDDETDVDSWPPWPLNSPVSVAGSPEHGEQQNEEHLFVPGAADNSPVSPMSDNVEGSSDDETDVDSWPPWPLNSPVSVAGSPEHGEQQNGVHSLVSGVADNSRLLPMNGGEEASSDEDEAQPKGIKCPICMDFYSKIVRSERTLLSTWCGHIFCSQCLPIALGTASSCPACRTGLAHPGYHPIYI